MAQEECADLVGVLAQGGGFQGRKTGGSRTAPTRGQMGLAQEEGADLVGVLEEVGGLTQGIFNGPN